MNKPHKEGKTCEETMKLLGDFWTLRIIDALKKGETRFCELQRELDHLNPVTLTKRLKLLEKAGLVTRSKETVDKISVTYSLTKLGKETLPIIKELRRFSEKTNSYIQ